MKRKLALYAALMLAVVGIAVAAVTLDLETGIGFVGKGDIQSPCGWNNAAAQANAEAVAFAYNVSETYDVTIEFETGNPAQPQSIQQHTVTQNKSTAVNASVASDPRRTGQYTGWNLTLGDTTTTGDAVPAVGDSCPNGNAGTCEVTAVNLVSSTGGLVATAPNCPASPITLVF